MGTEITPYLFFDGCCEEAFNAYAALLGGRIAVLARYGDMPPGVPVPAPGLESKVMHVSLEAPGLRLMGSDSVPQFRQDPAGFRVSLAVDEPAEAERVFAVLAEGGSVAMPLAETFWARRFGMVTDRFGTPWMVNCGKEA